MRLDTIAEPILDTSRIDEAVSKAEVPPLLVAVAHLTGDLSLLAEHLRPDPTRILEPEYGFTPEMMAEGRALAAGALMRFAAAGSAPAATPDHDTLRRMIEFLIGGPATDDYLPLLEEELALDGADLRAPSWQAAQLAPDTPFTVAVIGAGMSGIAVAHRLHQAGVPFVILEKNADVGGTWFENTYPGCRVDVPNHLYSYSFAQSCEWPQFLSTQPVLRDYFSTCAETFGLRDHIRFDTEVVACELDEATDTWRVRIRPSGQPDAAEEVLEVNAVVSAVGQLNRPKLPDIPGLGRFGGPAFHSAQWRADVDLRGKRVAVIGTGASAMQLIPPVAEEAGELFVFQRTPAWLIPSPTYHLDLPDGLQWLLHHVPGYARWDRLWLFWRTHEGLLPFAVVDPEWPHQERSVSLFNDAVRELFTAYFDAEFPDPDLRARVVPQYPPIAKRVVRDNGIWARTLMRPNVELVTDAISEIDAEGIVMVDGRRIDVDVIIYGTGFQASNFLTPMRVTGRGGVELHDRWHGDARAYLGLTVPGYPNLFMLYGPNTNIVINGSIVFFSECGANYIVDAVRLLLASGRRSIECREDTHDQFNEWIDERNRTMAWGASSVNSWYKNDTGRSAQNWPFSLLEYWARTRAVDPDDYVVR